MTATTLAAAVAVAAVADRRPAQSLILRAGRARGGGGGDFRRPPIQSAAPTERADAGAALFGAGACAEANADAQLHNQIITVARERRPSNYVMIRVGERRRRRR